MKDYNGNNIKKGSLVKLNDNGIKHIKNSKDFGIKSVVKANTQSVLLNDNMLLHISYIELVKKRPLYVDLVMPLKNMHRGWIRKPFTILLSIYALIVIIPISTIYGFKYFIHEFIIPTWNGEEIKQY